jgi:hypothetical protein
VVLVTELKVHPTAVSALCRFFMAWCVCSSTSCVSICPDNGLMPSCPEMKTKAPAVVIGA